MHAKHLGTPNVGLDARRSASKCLLAVLALSFACAAAAGPGGTVTIVGRFAADGTVAEAKVRFSEPEGKFDKHALAAIRSWKVKPWWAKSAKKGAEFTKTFNYFSDTALGEDPKAVEPTPAIELGEVAPDPSWGETLKLDHIRWGYWPSVAMNPTYGGWVRIAGVIGTDGETSELRVLESHPPAIFDDLVLRTYRRARFVRIDGAPIAAPWPFEQTAYFDAGYTSFEMMQAQFVTINRPRAQRLIADLASLCPYAYPRVDDELNRALVTAPRRRPLPTAPPPQLPETAPEAIELMLQYGECLYSSWEQLRDPRAWAVSSRFGWFDQSIYWRASSALCEKAESLGLTDATCRVTVELEDSDRKLARRWVAGQFGEAYQALISRRAADRGDSVVLAPETRVALDEVRKARADDLSIKAFAILDRAMRHASGATDRAVLRLTYARVGIDTGHVGEAQERIDAIISDPTSPWYAVQMARVLSFVVPAGWHGERNDFEATVTELNRELGVGDRLTF